METQNSKPNSAPRDVSATFNHYRVSARGIWNTAFWPDPDLRDWDSSDRFNEIQRLLFAELVLAKVTREWPLEKIFGEALPFFRIVPKSQEMTILIQNPRSETMTGYWDHPVNIFKRGETDLLFIEYFDWDRMDYIDFQYYRVKIARFDGHPELVGREALIECQRTAVQLVEE